MSKLRTNLTKRVRFVDGTASSTITRPMRRSNFNTRALFFLGWSTLARFDEDFATAFGIAQVPRCHFPIHVEMRRQIPLHAAKSDAHNSLILARLDVEESDLDECGKKKR